MTQISVRNGKNTYNYAESISYHRTKFGNRGDEEPGICALLFEPKLWVHQEHMQAVDIRQNNIYRSSSMFINAHYISDTKAGWSVLVRST